MAFTSTTRADPAHCSSSVKDVDESDVDCGGSCHGCVGGQHCTANADCDSGACDTTQGNLCQPRGLNDVAEVQIEISALDGLLNSAFRALRNSQLCSLPTTSCLLDPNQECLFDRVDFPGPVSLRRSSQTAISAISSAPVFFHPVQAVVPVTVHLMPTSCSIDPSSADCNFGGGEFLAPTVQVVLDLSATVTNGNVQVCTSLAEIVSPLPGVPIDIPAALTQPQCLPVSQLALLSEVAGANITNLAVSANTDLTRLAVRVWMGDEPPPGLLMPPFEPFSKNPDTVQSFFDGLIAPSPSGSEWSVYFGATLLADVAADNVFAQAAPLAANEGYTIVPGTSHIPHPDSVWLGGPLPGTQLNLGVHTDAGNCLVEGILTGNLVFSLDAANHQIHIDGTLDDDLGVYECWSAAFIDAFADIILDSLLPDETFVVHFFTGAECSINPSDRVLNCHFPTQSPWIQPFPKGTSVQVEATSVFGTSQGLLLGGAVNEIPGAAELPPSVSSLGEFESKWHCSGGQDPWKLGFTVEGSGGLCGDPQKINDGIPAYGITNLAPWTDALPHNFEVTDLLGTDAPYPLTVFIRTTGGSGIFEVQPPQKEECNQSAWECALDIIKKRIEQCYKDEDGWLGIPGKWDPHWSIDPMVNEGVINRDEAVRISLVNRTISSIGPVQRIVSSGDTFKLYQHAVRMDAIAMVDSRTHGSFFVPFSVDMILDFEGQEFPDAAPRLVVLGLDAPYRGSVEIRSGSLPAGVDSLGFDIGIGSNNMALVGFLPDEHMAASFTMDEVRGSTLVDTSGHGNIGDRVGTQLPSLNVAGYRNDGVDFEQGALICRDAPALNPSALSISTWFMTRMPLNRGVNQRIVGKEDDTSEQYTLSITDGGQLAFAVEGTKLVGHTVVSRDEWHHVVATYDGLKLAIYLDGQLETQTNATLTLADNEEPLYIGARMGLSDTFLGVLDDVRIYDTALTNDQAISPYW
ncbi:Hypothetical protein A7982_07654 [Minicystis rosea]|nr:Hypothetical protein A7982_07654 [Minicystis rosea]